MPCVMRTTAALLLFATRFRRLVNPFILIPAPSRLCRGCSILFPTGTRSSPQRSKEDSVGELENTSNEYYTELQQEGKIFSSGKDVVFAEAAAPGRGDDYSRSESYDSFLDELVARCGEATRGPGAMESPHTGSSEWAGFRTTQTLLNVSTTISKCRAYILVARKYLLAAIKCADFGKFACFTSTFPELKNFRAGDGRASRIEHI